MISSFQLWITGGIIAALLGFTTLQTVRLHEAEQALSQAEVAASASARAAAEALAKAQKDYRNKEHALLSQTAEIKRKSNEQINALSAQRSELLKRVRHAEARAATNLLVPRSNKDPGNGETPSGDAPTEFLGSLGSADVEEAARADQIRLSLLACYEQYDSVRDKLK